VGTVLLLSFPAFPLPSLPGAVVVMDVPDLTTVLVSAPVEATPALGSPTALLNCLSRQSCGSLHAHPRAFFEQGETIYSN